MPAKNPRINVVLEKQLYKAVSDLAKKEGMSLSMVTRDLLKEALELREDIDLARFAQTRDRTVKRTELLDHEDVWE
jgi:metal-responsive CopG/Arc/MetJ family transcriptional regulator